MKVRVLAVTTLSPPGNAGVLVILNPASLRELSLQVKVTRPSCPAAAASADGADGRWEDWAWAGEARPTAKRVDETHAVRMG